MWSRFIREMTALASAYASVVNKCNASRSAITLAFLLLPSLKSADMTAEVSQYMTTDVSGITVLLKQSLRSAFRNRQGWRQPAHPLAGEGLQHPSLHQALNTVLQGQIPGSHGHDFPHRLAVIGYYHFFAFLNEL
jgi:hypothetical protein